MSSNQQRQQSSGSGWGVWNGKGVPGLNSNRGCIKEENGNSSNAARVAPPPLQARHENPYPCQLPSSYGQGDYEEVQPWVASQPERLENERDEDYEWGDEPGARNEIPREYCPRIRAGPNCSHYLAPGETMEQCPYDKGHQVLTARFLRHLQRCRQNYVKTQKQNKKPIEIEVCQYDSSHHIRMDEMEEHFKTCKATIKYRKELENIRDAAFPSNMPTVEPPPTPRGVDCDRGVEAMEEENWELTAGATPACGFEPVENLARNGTLFFVPQGLTKSENKEFRANENARKRLLEKRQKYIEEQAKKYGFHLDADDDTETAGETDSQAPSTASTSTRAARGLKNAIMKQREVAAKKKEREERDAHFANDPVLAEMNAELEERAKIFKLFVYRTRPSDNWL